MGKTTEFIDREKARDIVCSLCRWEGTSNCVECEHPIDAIPAADVRPVVRGQWSRVYDDFMKSNYDTCSCCGKEYFGAYGFNFCPNCGADMREGS